jgi:hypothetical protein
LGIIRFGTHRPKQLDRQPNTHFSRNYATYLRIQEHNGIVLLEPDANVNKKGLFRQVATVLCVEFTQQVYLYIIYIKKTAVLYLKNAVK